MGASRDWTRDISYVLQRKGQVHLLINTSIGINGYIFRKLVGQKIGKVNLSRLLTPYSYSPQI